MGIKSMLDFKELVKNNTINQYFYTDYILNRSYFGFFRLNLFKINIIVSFLMWILGKLKSPMRFALYFYLVALL